ncbi:MAG: NADH-quinone oxidoreductase subunit L, partial [Actinomycetia bacterium]|nr:NADH-quinone oxidoreductase subunit L [Actinomycetes bacterium]
MTSAEHAGAISPAGADGAFSLLWLLVALPLASAAILLVAGRRSDKWGHLLGTATPIASFVIGVITFAGLLGRDADDRTIGQNLWTWIEVGGFRVDMDILYDPLSAVFVLLITGVGSLIHIYSIGYMAHDERRPRFFAYLNLFVAAMLTLVLASDYLVLFFGWEGVGLASYLLIGFWQHKNSAAVAAKKAFVVNRVGDMGMVLAISLMFAQFGTTSIAGVSGVASEA